MTSSITRPRGFALLVEPSGPDSFGLTLEEMARGDASARPVAHLTSDRTTRILEPILIAVKASGHSRSELASGRHEPLLLKESPGVRVALTMFATGPLRKHRRVDAAIAAIGRLSDEEAYYWYGKCIGQTASRARRALRLLLAEE
jgi:hypothetical protein